MTASASPAATRSRAARISLVVAYIALVLGPVSLCTCGPVFMGALAALLGLVPVLTGPARYRVLGAVPLLLGAAISGQTYPEFRREREAYRVRAELVEVVNLGSAIGPALDSRRLAGKPLPGSVEELGVGVPRAKVGSVGIESADRFVITLALPEAAGNALVFVAATEDGARVWQCASRGLASLARPAACRADADAPASPDRN
jgi:hypothetical protein